MARRLSLSTASTYQTRSVDWIWEPYIPRGFVTILAGPKWAGKTWATLGIVSGLSRGVKLPNMDKDPPALNIGMVSSEDPIEYVIRPRLEALGADLTRIHLSYGAVGLTPTAIAEIDKAVIEYDLSLFVVDPLLSFIPEGRQSISAESMRAILDPLGEIANRHGMAILVVTHLSKQPYTEALDRIAGSSQITAMARSVLLADRDPDNPDDEAARILVHAGTNLARPGPSWTYRISEQGTFEWGASPARTSANRLFGLDKEDLSEDLTGAAQDAFSILFEACGKDWAAAASVIESGLAAGVSERTMRRTASKFCSRRRVGVGTADQAVYWRVRASE